MHYSDQMGVFTKPRLGDGGTVVEKSKPVEYFRKDYQPYPYTIPRINLSFHLDEAKTTVVRRKL